MPAPTPSRLTIGQLAHHAGVSAQTLRHYDRLGLLRPAGTSAAGYRHYTDADRARLEVIRALRALDVDLASIGRLLAGATTLREVAELHLRTLDLQMRALARRRAVLRVLLRDGARVTADRLARLQVLAAVEARERAGFLAGQLDARLGGAQGGLPQALREVVAVELPDDPTDAQVDAWLELAALLSDETFLARHRERSASGIGPRPGGEDAARWRRRLDAAHRPAVEALRAGVRPDAPAARLIVRRWMRTMGASSPAALLAALEREHDPRETRFWELLAVLRPDVARDSVNVAWPWLVEALRALALRTAGARSRPRSAARG